MRSSQYVPWNTDWAVDYEEITSQVAKNILERVRSRMHERADMLLYRVSELDQFSKIGIAGLSSQLSMIQNFLWDSIEMTSSSVTRSCDVPGRFSDNVDRSTNVIAFTRLENTPKNERDCYLAIDIGLYLARIASLTCGPLKWSIGKGKTSHILNMAVCITPNGRQICPVDIGKTLFSAYCNHSVKKNLFRQEVLQIINEG